MRLKSKQGFNPIKIELVIQTQEELEQLASMFEESSNQMCAARHGFTEVKAKYPHAYAYVNDMRVILERHIAVSG